MYKVLVENIVIICSVSNTIVFKYQTPSEHWKTVFKFQSYSVWKFIYLNLISVWTNEIFYS